MLYMRFPRHSARRENQSAGPGSLDIGRYNSYVVQAYKILRNNETLEASLGTVSNGKLSVRDAIKSTYVCVLKDVAARSKHGTHPSADYLSIRVLLRGSPHELSSVDMRA